MLSVPGLAMYLRRSIRIGTVVGKLVGAALKFIPWVGLATMVGEAGALLINAYGEKTNHLFNGKQSEQASSMLKIAKLRPKLEKAEKERLVLSKSEKDLPRQSNKRRFEPPMARLN